MPPAADTMCCSAMPHSMKRSGSSSLNASMPQSDSRSPSMTTMSGRARAICSSSSPYASTRRSGLTGATRTGCGAPASSSGRLAEPRQTRVDPRRQLVDRREIVLQRRRTGVEVIGLIAARQAFHERDALALDGVGDQHLRPIGDGRKMREGVADRREVVAVGAAHLPAEGAELVLDRPEIADGGDRRVRLQLVVIDDRDDLRQPLVGARLQRFPDLPFLQLAVAGHQHDASAAAGEAVRARHAVRLRDAHAERSGVGRDERRRLDVGMAGQAAEAPQLVQQIEVELAERDQQRIERRRVVPLGREVDVGAGRAAVGVGELLGPQPRDQIGGAEARSDVAGAGLHDHVERVQAADVGQQGRALDRIRGGAPRRRRSTSAARTTARRRRRAACLNDLFRPFSRCSRYSAHGEAAVASSPSRPAAVDHQHRAGHVRRRARGEEHDRAVVVVVVRHAAERRALHVLGDELPARAPLPSRRPAPAC